MRNEDLMLIDRARDGDRSAFDQLVLKYEARAYQYAFRLTRDPEQAGDVVSDAFLRVYSALKNFRGQSAFSTWLYRIVTNCFLDRKKRDKDGNNVSLDSSVNIGDGEVERQYEDDSDGPAEIAERNARETAIQDALGSMPEYQRAMLIMYHVEGLSYEEISDALDLPIGTVKSRLNRARVALREQLSQNSELFQMG
ncbi:MAG: sigma-70 family RNA polymerase sigma factor [Armatimonadetes bacterium]|jgi:RNA polymerase sigma-70 factor (ECF subfamily)|nr:sigma-70 family RNA polymerase sigma factor [Armatimonadota bacterium]